jgi:hypothetical protein
MAVLAAMAASAATLGARVQLPVMVVLVAAAVMVATRLVRTKPDALLFGCLPCLT